MQIEGWENTTFDKHIDCITGFAFKSSEYSNDPNNIKLLRGDNIEPNSLRWREAKYWSSDKLQNLDRYFLEEGDFVIALDRTWITNGLKVAEIKESDIPCLLVQRVARIRAKITLEQSLLRQYFSGHQFEQYVKSVQTATAVPHISPNDIKEFPLLLPPIQEQKKIAEILSTWDKAIETVEKLVTNSQQQKKALMQQLLTGQKRLLDENGVKFGSEWEKLSLGDFGKCIRGVSYKPEDIVSEENETTVRLLRSTNIQEGSLNDKDLVILPKNKVKNVQVLKKDDLAVCMANGSKSLVGKSAPFSSIEKNYTVGAFCAVFRPEKSVSAKFVKFLFESEYYFSQISLILAGSSINNLKGSDIEAITFLAPKNIHEQEKIAQVLTLADREIDLYQQQLNKLKLEKKSLMQQLLTGQKRVKT